MCLTMDHFKVHFHLFFVCCLISYVDFFGATVLINGRRLSEEQALNTKWTYYHLVKYNEERQ